MRGFINVALLVVLASAMGAPFDDPVSVLLNSNLKFSNELYEEIRKSEKSNFVFSPMSIHCALSMLYQGATNTSYKALSEGLHVPEASIAAEGYKDIIKNLNRNKEISINLANKAYVSNDYSLQEAFEEVMRDKFYSEIDKIDFSDNQQAAKIINDWIEKKTKNKIRNLIQPSNLNPKLTRFVLINAIYFNGSWQYPFDEKKTTPEEFFINDKNWIMTPMMHQSESLYINYDSNLKAKILALPYKIADWFSLPFEMTIILPDDRNGITELESKLASYDLKRLQEGGRLKLVDVTLPKFKIEGDPMALGGILGALGLGEIMGENAKLEKIIEPVRNETLFVDEIVHKAFIEVSEKITEAAAVTAVGGWGSELREIQFKQERDIFKADHPFIFLLKEQRNGPILFYGRVINPDSKASVKSN